MNNEDLIFVTGATGFLGQHLTQHLLEHGYRLCLLVRSPSDKLQSILSQAGPDKVKLVIGDVTDPVAVRQGMLGCHIVVHAAGLFRLWGKKEEFDRVNRLGTQVVAEAAVQVRVKGVVYISTLAVVGQPEPGEVITEDSPCRPMDAYQQSKYAAEQVLSGITQAARLPTIILRPGAFYGPGSRYGFNRLFIEDPMRGLRLQIDRGQRLIFPSFIKDVARAVGSAVSRIMMLSDLSEVPSHSLHGEIYNICNKPAPHAQINQIVSQLLGISPWRLNVSKRLMLTTAFFMDQWANRTDKEPFYPLSLRYYVFHDWMVSNDKARIFLDFTPTPLEQGLHETVAWYKELEKNGWLHNKTY